MPEIVYGVRGFITVGGNAVRVPLHGSLTLYTYPDSGLFAGDLVLGESALGRALLGVGLVTGTVRITPESPVVGYIDAEGRVAATVTVTAAITELRARGRTLLSGGSCRTATHAVVPLRSRPGFDLAQGGRLAGTYYRPPFTGAGWLTPLINLVASGPGNGVAIDLIPARPPPSAG